MRTPATASVSLALAVAAACGDRGSMSLPELTGKMAVRTAAIGVRQEPVAPACSLAAHPQVQIGMLEGPSEYQLGSIPDAARMQDGRIAVVNRSTKEVRVFDARGAFLYSIGRDGGGPGEFRDPIQVIPRGGDSLFVWDWAQQRISLFGAKGHLLHLVSFRPAIANPLSQVLITDGQWPYWVASERVRLPDGDEFIPRVIELQRYDSAGSSRETVAVLPYGSIGWVNRNTRQYGTPLFDAQTSLATDSRRLFEARGDVPEIHVRDLTWASRRTIHWSEPNRRVARADAETYRRRVIGEQKTPWAEELYRMRFERVPVADSFPAVSELEADSRGWIWAKRFRRPTADTDTWLGFDEAGTLACVLTLPGDFRAREFGAGYVLGVATDEGGMQVVQQREFRLPARK